MSIFDDVPSEARPWLRRWLDAGALDVGQVERIAAWEREQPRLDTHQDGRVPSLMSAAVEALIYVGGAVVMAAIVVVAGGYWEHLSAAAQLAIPAVGTVLLLGAGLAVPRRWRDAGVRMRAALWLAATGTFFALVAVAVVRAGWSYDSEMITEACAVSALAIPLWLAHRTAAQQTAAFAAVQMLGIATWRVTLGFDALGDIGSGLTMTVIGLAWALLAWGGLLPGCGRWAPATVWDLRDGTGPAESAALAPRQRRWGIGLGTAGATLGGIIMAAGSNLPWLGLLPLVVLLVAGVVVGDLLVLIVAAVGTLITLPMVVDHYLDSTVATALVLLVVGALMVVLAILVARRQAKKAAYSR